jgi:uncharacterized protein
MEKVNYTSFEGTSALTAGPTKQPPAHPPILFDEKKILRELKHYLPSQTPLKEFIHHNTLHAFQHLRFYEGIFKAAKIFGYQVTLQLGEFRQLHANGRIKDDILERIITQRHGRENLGSWKENLLSQEYDACVSPRIGSLRACWKKNHDIDLDSLVQPLLFRILSSYLDQGISIWNFPVNREGFLASIRELEKNSFTSFFKTKRPRRLLLEGNCGIGDLLKIVVGDASCFEQYLFDQQFSHQGWSGLVSAIEDQPQSLLDRRNISLRDLVAIELLFEIDALDLHLGKKWEPLCCNADVRAVNLFADVPLTELQEVLILWQNAFEWSYYDDVLAGISQAKKTKHEPLSAKNFQAFFCIDERECSLRRHVESSEPHCETFGTPGFFGVEFFFQPENSKFYDKLCPAPVTPKYLIREFNIKEKRKHELLYTKLAQSLFIGFIITITLGFWSAIRLFQNLFRPAMSPAISNAFTHLDKDCKLTIENTSPDDRENNLQVGFTIEEMAGRVESVLRSIGVTRDFAPLIYVVAHGSSSANNPHHSAHDCGACSGRPGSVNARVFAFMANHIKVREKLNARGISLPADTRFVGALHDTASDQIAYYDVSDLSPQSAELHKKNTISFEKALDLNAKERSRRFASINTKMPLRQIRGAIRLRSVSMFEPRPELGHGTNSLCIIGSRNLTKNLFLDRRAFLNSYDYKSDADGKLLTGVMKPIGPVCGGINLEYYFSRVDNYKLGAGTKLPHNVVGLIGVANSTDGDLRPGLPVQMIEVHDPVRLLVVVEHFPEVVLKTIQSTPDMYEWFINDWVHLVALNPETHQFFYFNEGKFSEYVSVNGDIPSVANFTTLIESAKEMETNQIIDSTKENLPVYLIQ